MWTADDEARLNYLNGVLGQHPDAPSDTSGIGSRIGQQAANFIPNVAEGLTNSVIGLSNLGEPRNDQIPAARFPKFYDLSPAQGFGQQAVDVTAGIGQVVAEAAIPGGILTRAGRVAGLGRLAPIAADFGAGYLQGIKPGVDNATETGVEFGALGAANLIPNRGLRVLANAAVPVAGQLLRGQDPFSQQSLINTGANIAVPALLGQYGRRLDQRELLGRTPSPDTAEVARPVSEPIPAEQPDLFAGATAGPQPSILRPPDEVAPSPSERGFASNPALQYVGGASVGAVAGPLIDQDENKPVWEKMLEGAGVGLGAVAAGRGGVRALLHRAPEPVPTTVEDVAQMGGDRFKGATIRLVKNEGDLPPDWQAKIQPSLDAGNRHEGLVNPATGEVYLFKDNLSDPTRAAKVLAHEVAGHYGVEQLLSKPEWQSIQDSVLKPSNTAAQDISEAYFKTRDISSLSPEAKTRVTREYIARLAENTPLNPNLWEKLKTGVNRATRALGRDSDWSDSELQGLVQRGATRAEAPPARGVRSEVFPAGSEVPDPDYERLAKERFVSTVKTSEVVPTDSERIDIKKAYEQAVVNRETPAVPIADVLEKAGFSKADMDRGRGILMHMFRSGEIESLPVGDWSYSSPRERAWSVTKEDSSGPMNIGPGSRGVLMRMPHGEGIVRQAYGLDPSFKTAVKSLLPTRQAGQEQERGNPSVGGKVYRMMQQNFGLGKQGGTLTAEELGKGHVQLLRKQIEPLIPLLAKADKNEQGAISLFSQSAPTPQSVSLLRATVRPEIAGAVERAGELITKEQKLAGIHPEDPTYRTTRYAAFQDPERWIKSLRADPTLRQNYIDRLIADRALPGFSHEDVAQAVDEYTADIQRGNDFSSPTASNSKIGREIFMKKDKLTPEHEKFMGMYENPAQRIAFTLGKLANSAAQAKKISVLADMGANGELDIMDQGTRQAKAVAAQQAGDTATVERLGALHRMPSNRAYGALAGKYVPTDVLDSMNAHNELWTGGWLKTFSTSTSVIKQSMTVFNPATHIRQWIQTPLLAAAARVAPQDFFAAGRAIRAKGAEWEELVRNHIVGADFSSSELAHAASQMDLAFNPSKASKAAGVWSTIKGAAQKAYGLPDNLVRAAAYLKQKPRFFAEGNAMGLKGAELEQYAQRKAMEFTNRYTMNYGAVSNAVKVARETPFVSPFISYQAEMLRVLKNLGEDALHGSPSDRVWALGNIAGLVAMPLVAMQFAKGQLSDEDQKAWDQVQRLSPAYAAGQIRMPLSRKKDGSFRYINIGNLMPAGDFSAVARNMASGDIAGLIASNPYVGWEKTPVFNTITEQVTGRDSVTDAKLDTAGRAGALAKNFLPPWVPPGYEGKRILQSLTPNDQGGLGLTNPRTGQTATPGLEAMRISGIPVSDVQPRQLLRRAAADLRDTETQIKSELKQTISTNASPEVKQAAREEALFKLGNARAKYMATKDGVTIQVAKSKVAKAQALGWSIQQ